MLRLAPAISSSHGRRLILPVGGRITQRDASLLYLNSLPVYSPSNYLSLSYPFMVFTFLFALTSYFLLQEGLFSFKKWIIVLNVDTAVWMGLIEKQPERMFNILLSHNCTARESSCFTAPPWCYILKLSISLMSERNVWLFKEQRWDLPLKVAAHNKSSPAPIAWPLRPFQKF